MPIQPSLAEGNEINAETGGRASSALQLGLPSDPSQAGGGGGRKGCITQPRRLSDPSPFTRLHRALQGFGFTGHGKVKAGLKMASRKLDGEN